MEGETEGVIQGTELVALPLWARPSLWPQPGQGPALECGAGILFQSPLSAAGDMGISHFKIPKPPRSHWPLQLLWLLVPVPTPLCPRLGWGREGEAGCPSGGGGGEVSLYGIVRVPGEGDACCHLGLRVRMVLIHA